MTKLLAILTIITAFGATAAELDQKERKALTAAEKLYAMNITPTKKAATFFIAKKDCGGEDGTQVCVLTVRVREKNPEAGVTSYVATFMNDQLQRLEQNCNYCW